MKHIVVLLLSLFFACSLWAFDGKDGALLSKKAMAFTENCGEITDQFGNSRSDIQFKTGGGVFYNYRNCFRHYVLINLCRIKIV